MQRVFSIQCLVQMVFQSFIGFFISFFQLSFLLFLVWKIYIISRVCFELYIKFDVCSKKKKRKKFYPQCAGSVTFWQFSFIHIIYVLSLSFFFQIMVIGITFMNIKISFPLSVLRISNKHIDAENRYFFHEK